MNEIDFYSNYTNKLNVSIMGQPNLYGNHYATNVYPIMTSKNLFPILITLWEFFQNLLDDHNMFENKTNKKEKNWRSAKSNDCKKLLNFSYCSVPKLSLLNLSKK